MRIRTLLFIVAAALVVAFAFLNWPRIMQPTPLDLGFTQVTAPLGLVLLSLLAAAVVISMVLGASTHTRHLLETRQHARALQAQRELAERAEASRFVDLRQHLESHLRETRQRETNAAAELEQAVSRIQREVRNQIDQVQRTLAMRLGEMEARVSTQLDRLERGRLGEAPIQAPVAESADAQTPRQSAPMSFDRVR